MHTTWPAVITATLTQVLDDMQDTLPPVPEEGTEADARAWAWEIYSSTRMQLAALPDDLLQQVCGEVGRGNPGQGFLASLRAMRPVAGGAGWDKEVGMGLRALNFDLSGSG
jgi:hypothetical protein